MNHPQKELGIRDWGYHDMETRTERHGKSQQKKDLNKKIRTETATPMISTAPRHPFHPTTANDDNSG